MADDSIVRISGFVKRYKQHVAVNQVDLTIKKGEIYGLIGPDGSGKSSLMKAIAGVLSYEGGAVEVLGVRVDSARAAELVKQRVGFRMVGAAVTVAISWYTRTIGLAIVFLLAARA